MLVLRDEKKILQRKRISQVLSAVGMIVLIGGFIMGLQDRVGIQLVSLAVGFMISQVAVFMAHRYVREPRPDKLLDDALKKVARGSRLYHYLLPAHHVLLTPAGPIIFHLKYQPGDITVTKDKNGNDKWQQKKVGFLRRFFGQESIGNPTREADLLVQQMGGYLKKHAPEIADLDIPMGVIIVLTHSYTVRGKGNNKDRRVSGELDLKASTFTALHVSKVRGYFRSNKLGDPLPKEVFASLQKAFDLKAQHLIDSGQEIGEKTPEEIA